MMIHDITVLAGRHKRRKRVGRGEGSGHGKQSGRGNKGAGSRSGYAAKRAFEGGQMPYFRRLAQFGFTNAQFNAAHPAFAKGGAVNADTLMKAGLIRDDSRDLKILGGLTKAGEEGLKVKLNIKAQRVSDKARQIVVAAGGSVEEIGTRRDKNRGVNRNSDDRAPKNLTKKLKRGSGSKAKKAEAANDAEIAAKPEGKKKA